MRKIIEHKLAEIEKQKAKLETQRIVLLIAQQLVEKMALPEDMAIRAVNGIDIDDGQALIKRFNGENIPFDLRPYIARIKELKLNYGL